MVVVVFRRSFSCLTDNGQTVAAQEFFGSILNFLELYSFDVCAPVSFCSFDPIAIDLCGFLLTIVYHDQPISIFVDICGFLLKIVYHDQTISIIFDLCGFRSKRVYHDPTMESPTLANRQLHYIKKTPPAMTMHARHYNTIQSQ